MLQLHHRYFDCQGFIVVILIVYAGSPQRSKVFPVLFDTFTLLGHYPVTTLSIPGQLTLGSSYQLH